jgi:hypothetical protein
VILLIADIPGCECQGVSRNRASINERGAWLVQIEQTRQFSRFPIFRVIVVYGCPVDCVAVEPLGVEHRQVAQTLFKLQLSPDPRRDLVTMVVWGRLILPLFHVGRECTAAADDAG